MVRWHGGRRLRASSGRAHLGRDESRRILTRSGLNGHDGWARWLGMTDGVAADPVPAVDEAGSAYAALTLPEVDCTRAGKEP